MIIDPRVFEDIYLPRELMHRESEVGRLSRAFQPALSGSAPHNALISGPSGVGKTVLARHTLDRLEKRAPVSHAHIRCLGKSTGAILREVLRQHPADVSEQFSRSTPVDGVHQLLRDTVEYPFVVILDEADNVHNHDVIERLHAVPRISIVAICHDPQSWLAQIPMNGSHSFDGDRHIQLRRYGTEELADILEARANQGLAKDLVTRDQLRTIANHVAGVARFGIQSLYAAVELGVKRSHETIRSADIEDSYDRALHRIRQPNLNSLPLHHHVLYELIRVAGEFPASELHERYENAAKQLYAGYPQIPIGKRSRRNKLTKLREYELFEHEGPPQNRVVDTARELERETVVVLTADHGEEFREHGDIDHNAKLYDEFIHVPLIVSKLGSEAAQARHSQLISCVDLLPSMYSNLVPGASVPDSVEGQDIFESERTEVLSETLRTAHSPEHPNHVGTSLNSDYKRIAARSHSEKMILRGDNNEYKYYDLDSDPMEQHNLAPEQKIKT